jgi:hypothetical protein
VGEWAPEGLFAGMPEGCAEGEGRECMELQDEFSDGETEGLSGRRAAAVVNSTGDVEWRWLPAAGHFAAGSRT